MIVVFEIDCMFIQKYIHIRCIDTKYMYNVSKGFGTCSFRVVSVACDVFLDLRVHVHVYITFNAPTAVRT